MIVDVSFQWTSVFLSLVAGFGLGLVYFRMLWWTSRQLTRVKKPALLFFGSFVFRLVGLVGGMFWITRGRIVDTTVCVIGVIIARHMTVGHVKRETKGAWADGN